MGIYHHKFETLQEVGGKFSEYDALGGINVENPEYRAAYESFVKNNRQLLDKAQREGVKKLSHEERGKLFTEGVRLVEQYPAENPIHPERPLLRDLRLEVAELLGLQGEDMDMVKIFSSIRTPIDALFGADGFIRVDDINGRDRCYVTFDYTVGKKVLHDTGADVLIANFPDPELEEAAYLSEIAKIAHDIHVILIRRKNSPNNTPY